MSRTSRQVQAVSGPHPVGSALVLSGTVGAGALAACFVLLRPVGDYIVDDEWAFLVSLRHLQEEGAIRILDWNPMSLIGHLFWGLLFTKPFGFSFTAARISTLVLFAALCAAVGGLLGQFGVRRSTIVMAVLVLVFNPLSFFHGFLYVTDIPALAWTAMAVLLMARGLEARADRGRWLLPAGSLAAAFGYLLRQSVALAHVALLAELLIFERRRLRTVEGILAAVVIPAATITGFQFWYQNVHGPTEMFLFQKQQILSTLLHPQPWAWAVAAYKDAVYVGFFLFPLAVALRPSQWRKIIRDARPIALAVAAAICAAMFLVVALREGLTFPSLPNKITPFGYLSPNELIAGDRDVLWSPAWGWPLGAAFLASFVGFVGCGLCRRAARTGPDRRADGRAGLRLVLLLGALQTLYALATQAILFDRHLLMLLPTAVVLFCAWNREARPSAQAFALPLAAMIAYGLAGTHDVHAFSREAFRAGQSLMARGVPAHFIDAGYAFDGWHTFEEWTRERIRRARPTDAWWVQEICQGVDTRLVLSLSPGHHVETYRRALLWSAHAPDLRGYQVVETWPYTTWWPPRRRMLYAMARR